MKYFVTTAIDYTNAAPHIGHAYEKILADVIIRYRRTQGPAFLLIGVDQHGQKVQQAAQRENIAPVDFAERVTGQFLALWEKLNIQRDGWAATTDPRHKRAVQKVLQALHDKGELYKAKYSGYYSVRQEQFLTDKERNAEGEFGPEWGEVVLLEEENWYFCLAKHKDWLINFVRTHPDFVIPAFRQVELLNAIDRLSGDLCVSRPKERLSWGIEYFADLWPCQAHIIGKDIMVPAHGIYWPIMLHAMGFPDDQMPRLAVHGWWNVEGAKMSKSLGNVVDPFQLAEQFGADAVRYYLMRDIATGHDADFSVDRLLIRYHSDLANGLGNLVNRTINMVQRYHSGLTRRIDTLDPEIEAIKTAASSVLNRYQDAFAQFQPHTALEAVSDLVTQANGLVELKAPWKLAKDPAQTELLHDVLYTLAETSRFVAALMEPVIPKSAQKILDQLNATDNRELAWGKLPAEHQLGEPNPVFPRFDDR